MPQASHLLDGAVRRGRLRVFVADTSRGSRHNRGCAVDLTPYDRKRGKPVEMTGGFGGMTDRSYPD